MGAPGGGARQLQSGLHGPRWPAWRWWPAGSAFSRARHLHLQQAPRLVQSPKAQAAPQRHLQPGPEGPASVQGPAVRRPADRRAGSPSVELAGRRLRDRGPRSHAFRSPRRPEQASKSSGDSQEPLHRGQDLSQPRSHSRSHDPRAPAPTLGLQMCPRMKGRVTSASWKPPTH